MHIYCKTTTTDQITLGKKVESWKMSACPCLPLSPGLLRSHMIKAWRLPVRVWRRGPQTPEAGVLEGRPQSWLVQTEWKLSSQCHYRLRFWEDGARRAWGRTGLFGGTWSKDLQVKQAEGSSLLRYGHH